MSILIIGASGYVGSALYDHYKTAGSDVVGTCFFSSDRADLVRFDIAQDDISKLVEGMGSGAAVICSAVSKISQCRTDHDRAYAINVSGTKHTIKKLHDLGWKVIFLSSDNVFGDELGDHDDDDDPSPINEYGKMKAEIELYIRDKYTDVCVFRLSKIVGKANDPHDMLREWKTLAAEGKTIRCIKGNIFNPVDIEDVVRCVELVREHELCGFFNICGEKGSRADLCRRFLKSIGTETDITEEPLSAFGFEDTRPLDTSMKNTKFTRATGFRFTPFDDICKKYI